MRSTAGVEIYLLENDKIVIRYAKIKRKRNIVTFEEGEYNFQCIADLLNRINGSLPIALCLSGKGIIHRSFPSVKNFSAIDYGQKIIPTATTDDFFIQLTTIREITFVSMARRDTIKMIISDFENAGLEIHTLTLGPFALIPVWSYLHLNKSDTFQLDAHLFEMTEDKPTGYILKSPLTERSDNIRFANEEMSECMVTAYATGLCLIAGISFPTIELNSFGISKENIDQRSIFKKVLPTVLGIFLLALLANTYFYSYYSLKMNEVNTDSLGLLKAEENRLINELENDQNLINNITRPLDSKYGSLVRLSDLLAASQPSSITLEEMTIFPRDKKESRRTRKSSYDFTLVRISGNCENGIELNTWINIIRQFNFCKKVEISEYTEENNSSRFTLNLKVE